MGLVRKEFDKNFKTIADLLVDNLTVDGMGLDRDMFYVHTKDMDISQMVDLKDTVRARVARYYADVNERQGSPGLTDRDVRFIDGALDGWFRPWTRLAGRIENDIEDFKCADTLDERKLSDICLKYFNLPEYKPYGKEFMGFVYNRCSEEWFDYNKIDVRLQDDVLVKQFRKELPYLIREMDKDLLSVAYQESKFAPDGKRYSLNRPVSTFEDILDGFYFPASDPSGVQCYFRSGVVKPFAELGGDTKSKCLMEVFFRHKKNTQKAQIGRKI